MSASISMKQCVLMHLRPLTEKIHSYSSFLSLSRGHTFLFCNRLFFLIHAYECSSNYIRLQFVFQSRLQSTQTGRPLLYSTDITVNMVSVSLVLLINYNKRCWDDSTGYLFLYCDFFCAWLLCNVLDGIL